MSLQDLRARLQKLALDFPEISLVYLFGSQVTGPTGPASDYDLGVLVDRHRDTAAQGARIAHEVKVILETDRVDVVYLNQAPLELAYTVISQGVCLYERDRATRVEYEAYVLGRYCDYLPVLRAQRAEILRGGDVAKRVQRYREALGRTERTLREIRAAQGKRQERV